MRPKTIQQHRGITDPPDERTEPYSPQSYAAQYGIAVEDAEEILEGSNTHQQAERGIFALYKMRPGVKARALFLEAEPELTDAEREKLRAGGVDVAQMVEEASGA